MERWIPEILAASGFGDLPQERLTRLGGFIREVEIWSERIHLLGRGRLQENLKLQTLDSLLLLSAAERATPKSFAAPAPRLADIGSGAGFPGLVWKIARPEISVVLFERKLKTQTFLERTIAVLGLREAEASQEDAASSHREEAFDLVTSKAAGRFHEMLPIASRLLVPGGVYVTIKGASKTGELRGARSDEMESLSESKLPEGRGLAYFFRKKD